ncbi:MAG: bile acid:sodium symporter, partial [Pseudomonadota bacterium]|nr:bile acid:sodium symporter [Pseudomonadota bacterium]
LFFGSGPLAAGQTLLGTLPTDVSSPLLVLMAKGNVALAAVFNAVNTALCPFIVPFLFLWLTGLQLDVPLGSIILELTLIVLLPTVIGVSLRTRFSAFFARHDSAYAGIGSILYLLILLAVVGPNATTIIGYGWYAFVIAGAALCLNLIGYLVGMSSRLLTSDRKEVITYLFTVSKKEFSIAAAFVAASGLPSEIAIPAAFFAVIQMITSPIAAKILARHGRDGRIGSSSEEQPAHGVYRLLLATKQTPLLIKVANSNYAKSLRTILTLLKAFNTEASQGICSFLDLGCLNVSANPGQ